MLSAGPAHHHGNGPHGHARTLRLAVVTLLIGVAVFALKMTAWWLTGSVALFSDALESTVNIAASFVSLIALRVAATPADADHPYGHHKAEYVSAVAEGVLIVVAAVAILREAVLALVDPHPVDVSALGLAVSGVATVINGVWSAVLIRQGRRWRSPALVADGKHLAADVATSVGVFVGVGLVALTGWQVLDPLIAAAVALNVLWTGYGLMRDSVSGLMDAAAPPQLAEQIRRIVSDNAIGAIEAHDLRTRVSGRVSFLDFHLVVPDEMTVASAHAICDRIEDALAQSFPELEVTIHVEPAGLAKGRGVRVV